MRRTALAFPVPRLEVRGHDEIDRRVTEAYADEAERVEIDRALERVGDRAAMDAAFTAGRMDPYAVVARLGTRE